MTNDITQRRHPFLWLSTLTLLAILVAGVMAYAGGWISFSQTGSKATLEVNKIEIREKVDQAVEAGQDLLQQTGKAIEKAGEKRNESETHNPTTR